MPTKEQTKAALEKKAEKEILPFRDQINALIQNAKTAGVPIEEIQSALDSEKDIVDLHFASLVKKKKK